MSVTSSGEQVLSIRKSPGRLRGWPVCILLLHVLLVGRASWLQGVVIDEQAHLAAGFSHLRFQRFDQYCVNPPIPRMIAAIPLLFMSPVEDWASYDTRPRHRSEFTLGRRLASANPDRFMDLWRAGRLMMVSFSLLGAIVCFRWATELYGRRAGLCAMLLWCFSPTVLTNVGFVLPDAPAAAMTVTACYVFRRWLFDDIGIIRTVQFGVIYGLSLGTKSTLLILTPYFIVVRLLYWAASRRHRLANEILHLSGAFVLGLYILNLSYLFEGSLKAFNSFLFLSEAMNGLAAGAESLGLGAIPLPVPEYYVLGIDFIKHEFEDKYWSYLGGEWKFGGWWYYYLYAMAVKMPVGSLFLIVWSCCLSLTSKAFRSIEDLLVVAPSVLIITFVSRETGFNHHLRYILPAFPFLFIFASRILSREYYPSALVTYRCATVCLSSLLVTSVWASPNFLPFFNLLVGGTANGHKHLHNSNIDWGQANVQLASWLETRQDQEPLTVVGNGMIPMELYGIQEMRRPEKIRDESGALYFPPGHYAISVGQILWHGSEWEPFLKLTPEIRVADSVYVYHLKAPLKANSE